jgi:hypothetical protein
LRRERFALGLAAALAGGVAALVWAAAPKKDPIAERPPQPFLSAARALLALLDAEQRARITIPFDSDERRNWHYVPRERRGLTLGAMSAAQRKAALALLRAGLSAPGYEKAEAIRALEPILRRIENDNPGRDPERYTFTIFGAPGEREPWGWRYEGHHISLNWTVVNGRVVGDSPQFFGANPARGASKPLAAEEDLARALVQSLDAAQRKQAILSAAAPPEILTGAQRQAAIQEDRGIAYAALRPEQQRRLLALLGVYADAMPPPVARKRLEKIRRAGLAAVKFAWMGGLEPGQGHYYRLQGPTFLVEYDNTQNNANHIHTVWRDFRGDFGADLLAEHLKAAHGGN